KGFDSESAPLEDILRTLVKSFLQAKRAVDRRRVDLALEFLQLMDLAFSFDSGSIVRVSEQPKGSSGEGFVPLSSLVSVRSYRISELRVEFGVAEEDGRSDSPHDPTRFRFVSPGAPAEHLQAACIRIVGGEDVSAEFQIAGKTKATLTLAGS
ncbi:MAG TPA: hypothetical protein VEZ90_19985, partial [Blastocatellia bacterium]|nr:hypothetical protein [Blastocatellia bacterium]